MYVCICLHTCMCVLKAKGILPLVSLISVSLGEQT